MTTHAEIYETQLKQTCRITGSSWAVWAKPTENGWDFGIRHALSKGREAALQQLLQQSKTGSWLAGALSGGRMRTKNITPLTEALNCRQLYAFPNPETQSVILVGADRLSDEARGFFRVLAMRSPAEKLVAAGRLTASIAHEINNPLQALQNCLHLAGRTELTAEQRQSYLELAQSELSRLMSTVQRMLDLYRPAALERKPIDVNNLIRRVVQLLEGQAEQQKVRLHLDLKPALPPALVVGDQIQQVILNLALNGLQAMPVGGELFIQTRAKEGAVQVIIEDTGPGVPPVEREHLFEPFSSTKENGLGLGLAVSYGIITAHGGRLELAAGQGCGACFQIILPTV